MNVWLDLEDVNGDVFEYANHWYAEVAKVGYVPGVYVGAGIVGPNDLPVTGEELYTELWFQHYWHSCSRVPNVERGYQMIQLSPGNLSLYHLGFLIDIVVTQHDYRSGTVQWLSPA